MVRVSVLPRTLHEPAEAIPRYMDVRTRRDLLSRRLWRKRGRHLLRVSILVLGDAAGAASALALALHLDSGWPAVSVRWSAFLPLTLVLVLAAQAAVETYGPGRSRRRYGSAFTAGVLASLGLPALGEFYAFLRLDLGAQVVLAGALGTTCALVRFALDQVIRAAYRRGFGCQRAVVVGSDKELEEVRGQANARPDANLRVLGRIGLPGWRRDESFLGPAGALEDVIERHAIQSVIISARLAPTIFRDVTHRAALCGCDVSIVPADLQSLPLRVSNYDINGWPMLELEVPRLHLVQVVLKRSLDVVLSAVGLLFLIPVFAVVALAVRLDSSGPILFRQRRLGLGGRRFTLYKFRSMRADAEGWLRDDPSLYEEYVENGFKLPASRDPRIHPLGALLRRTSLDELPQLFNVLKGDMSLVGPRPVVPDEIENYGNDASVFLAVKPGLTGYWQVNGRSEVGYPERVDLDIDYIHRWSLGRDLSILLRTVPTVLRREGAH